MQVNKHVEVVMKKHMIHEEVFIKNKDMIGEAGNLAFEFAISKVDSENTELQLLMAKLSFESKSSKKTRCIIKNCRT